MFIRLGNHSIINPDNIVNIVNVDHIDGDFNKRTNCMIFLTNGNSFTTERTLDQIETTLKKYNLQVLMA